jgi:hypothetical protein
LTRLGDVSKYHQDDTAESIIVRKMFPHEKFWDEPTIRGFQCDDCDQPPVKEQRWDDLPLCPRRPIGVRLHDLMVLHTFGFQGGIPELLRVMNEAPDWVYIYDDIMPQQIRLCQRGNLTRIFDPLAPREELMLLPEDIPDPLIKFDWLRNDND